MWTMRKHVQRENMYIPKICTFTVTIYLYTHFMVLKDNGCQKRVNDNEPQLYCIFNDILFIEYCKQYTYHSIYMTLFRGYVNGC